MSRPMSAVWTTYVFVAAPVMTTPSRSQATEVVVGLLRKPPLTHVIVEPTVGVPVIDGLATGSGGCTNVPFVGAETTLMASGAEVATLPATSTASAVIWTVLPTAEAGAV